MAKSNSNPTVRRTLQFKFTLPGGDAGHIVTMLKAARPFIEAWGGKRSRLLRNVDDPGRFVHEIEYETHETMELNRQRIASDPRLQVYMQTWRSMFPGGVEIDVYDEISDLRSV